MGASIWTFLHTGKEAQDVAKRDWQIAGALILGLGAVAGTSLL